jgi:uncharacterized protein (UPF0335 family)
MTSNSATILHENVQDIERLLGDIDGIKEIIKSKYEALEQSGFNIPAVRKLIAIRRKDDRDKEVTLLNDLLLYAKSTGTNLDVEIP